MRKFSVHLILLISFLNLAFAQDNTGSISGEIVDKKGEPLKGCLVTLSAPGLKKRTAVSSAGGKFEFRSLPPRDDYSLIFDKDKYILKGKRNIPVTRGENLFIRIRLKRILGNIPGRWHRDMKRTTAASNKRNKNAKLKETMRKLETLGYLAGSRKAPIQKDITRYIKHKAYNGLNLYCSGHGPEAILMDMKGNVLHRWRYEMRRIWKNYKRDSLDHQFWRRVHLLKNGDLLAIYDGYGLIRLDKDSNLIWAYKGRAHHDLFVTPDKKIYVLTRKAAMNPKYHKDKPILEDFIAILDFNGKEISQVSILKCLENSGYPILEKMTRSSDILHTNTIELLDGKLMSKSPAFKKGNILISSCYFDMIAVVDFKAQKVDWTLSDMWKRQHQPTVLDNGHMLIFDNRGGVNGQSRVLEFEPITKKVVWSYEGTPKKPFFSSTCGSCQRLPNGNTLVTESDAGRAFEVTPDKKIVWEFINPHRAGRFNELIATLFEVIRLEPGFSLDRLKKEAQKK